MNVLFLADPNSIHDRNWISYLVASNAIKAFVIPLHSQLIRYYRQSTGHEQRDHNFTISSYIKPFSLIRIFRTLYDLIIIKRQVRRHRIDIIHIMYAEPNALWGLFYHVIKVPIVLTTRGTDILYTIPVFFKKDTFHRKVLALMYKKALRNIDWITVTSEKQRQKLHQLTNRNSNIVIIRTGVDIGRIKKNTESYMPNGLNSPFILFPRLMRPIYNHEFSIRAISLLPLSITNKYTMVFLGSDEPDLQYISTIKEMLGELRSGVKTVFLPKQTQESVWELYKQSSLVVMNPISDGSPVSAMEAAVCKVPVILPPLDYDMDIFCQGFFRFEFWKESCLAELIENLLERDGVNLDVNETLFDRSEYMKKLWEVYCLCTPTT